MSGVLEVETLARGACRTDVAVTPSAYEHSSGLQREQLLARLRENIGSALELAQRRQGSIPIRAGRSRAGADLGFASRRHQNL